MTSPEKQDRAQQLQTLILRVAVVPFAFTMILTVVGAVKAILHHELGVSLALLLLPVAWAASLWWGSKGLAQLKELAPSRPSEPATPAARPSQLPPGAASSGTVVYSPQAEIQLLLALSTECVRAQEFAPVAQAVVEAVRRFLKADAVFLGMCEEGSQELRIEAASGDQTPASVGLERYHRLIWTQSASSFRLVGAEALQEAFPNRFEKRWGHYFGIPLGIREPLKRGLADSPVATLGPSSYVLDGVLEVLYGESKIPALEGEGDSLRIVGHLIEIAISNWKLDRKLQQEKNFIEIVLEGMADGVITVEGGGRITSCNEAASRLLGRRRNELLGGPIEMMIPGYLLPERRGWSQLISAGAAIQEFSVALPLAGVGVRTLAMQVSHRQREGASVAVLVFRDVSKLRELEELRSDFTATLSHELRTPLTGMKGYLQMLMHRKAREFDHDKIQGIVAIINHQADQLHRLILDLLEAAKLKSQALEICPQPTELSACVREACLRQSSKDLKVEVVDNCWALCDGEKIQGVLSHLISNALKYSVPGGTVEVACRMESGFATVSIRDEGVGIPLDQQDKIFEMYHRVDTGNTRTHYGVGLGLYLARKVVEAHGGQIEVVSTPGCGATFSFTLPLAAPPVPSESFTSGSEPG